MHISRMSLQWYSRSLWTLHLHAYINLIGILRSLITIDLRTPHQNILSSFVPFRINHYLG